MANITIHCWNTIPAKMDDLTYPPDRTYKIVSPLAQTLDPAVHAVIITASADTRMTLDGSAVTGGDMPIFGAVPNYFVFTRAPPTGAVLTFA